MDDAQLSGLHWYPVVPRGELPRDGGGLSTTVAGRPVALFDHAGEVYALDDTCPHQGASLGLGVALDGDVTCPWHGWHFALATGENTDGLATCVDVHPVRIAPDGRVEVALPSGDSSGGDVKRYSEEG